MSWLNTFVNAASAGANIAQLSKLHDLEQQGADAAMIQAVLQALRNQIFEYSQAAKQVLTVEEQTPKLAAGGMRVLQLRIEDSGIRPEMFPDLQDKEYVADTYRMVQENDFRLFQQLPEEAQAEVVTAAEAADNLPQYDYYLTHYDVAQEVKTAVSIYEKYKSRNSCLFRSITGFSALFIAPWLLFGFASIMGNAIGNWAGNLFAIIALIAWFGLLFGITKLNNASAFNKAQKTIQKYEDSDMNLDRFAHLEAEFGDDKTAVIQLRDQAKQLVDDFFQGTQFLTD